MSMFSEIKPPSGSGKWASVWPVFSKRCSSFVVCKYFTVKVLTNKGHLCSWHAAKPFIGWRKWYDIKSSFGELTQTQAPFFPLCSVNSRNMEAAMGFLVPAGEFTCLGWVLGLCRMLRIGSVRCMAPNAPHKYLMLINGGLSRNELSQQQKAWD